MWALGTTSKVITAKENSKKVPRNTQSIFIRKNHVRVKVDLVFVRVKIESVLVLRISISNSNISCQS